MNRNFLPDALTWCKTLGTQLVSLGPGWKEVRDSQQHVQHENSLLPSGFTRLLWRAQKLLHLLWGKHKLYHCEEEELLYSIPSMQ